MEDDQKELLKGNTPTMVLAVLSAGGPQHAYAIGRALKERVGEAIPFQRGTLYPVLHTLERDGLVEGVWETEASERPRRVYTLTDAGRHELERRAERWGRFARAMDTLIAGAVAEPGGLREEPA